MTDLTYDVIGLVVGLLGGRGLFIKRVSKGGDAYVSVQSSRQGGIVHTHPFLKGEATTGSRLPRMICGHRVPQWSRPSSSLACSVSSNCTLPWRQWERGLAGSVCCLLLCATGGEGAAGGAAAKQWKVLRTLTNVRRTVATPTGEQVDHTPNCAAPRGHLEEDF